MFDSISIRCGYITSTLENLLHLNTHALLSKVLLHERGRPHDPVSMALFLHPQNQSGSMILSRDCSLMLPWLCTPTLSWSQTSPTSTTIAPSSISPDATRSICSSFHCCPDLCDDRSVITRWREVLCQTLKIVIKICNSLFSYNYYFLLFIV